MSFVATTALTSVAVVVAYLSDSLPDATLTQLDWAFLIKFEELKWRLWFSNPFSSGLLTMPFGVTFVSLLE